MGKETMDCKKLIMVLVVVVVVLVSGCAQQQIIPSTSEAPQVITEVVAPPPKIDHEILSKLKTETRVKVIVTLKDNSNIVLRDDMTAQERHQALLENDRQNLIVQSALISSLSAQEFEVVRSSSFGRWFSGYTTNRGIEKLRHDPRVERVYLPTLSEPQWE